MGYSFPAIFVVTNRKRLNGVSDTCAGTLKTYVHKCFYT